MGEPKRWCSSQKTPQKPPDSGGSSLPKCAHSLKTQDQGAHIEQLCCFQVTVLHLAALFNSAPVLKALLEAGAQPRAEDSEKRSPLQLAALRKDGADLIKVLVVGGADVKVLDSRLQTPLHLAAKNFSYTGDLVKTLIEAGADINARDRNQQTPLHLALAGNSSADTVSALVDFGADVDLCDKDKQTPLHLAAKHSDDVDVVKMLMESSANDGMLQTLLDLAVSHNPSVEVVKMLVLECGVDLSAADSKDKLQTLLYSAAKHNTSVDVVKMLIKSNATMQHDQLQTLFEIAVSHNTSVEFVKILMEECGVDLSEVGKDKLQTLLYLAAKQNTSVEVIGMLIRAGADVDSKNEDEMSSLDLATKYNPCADVVETLIKSSGNMQHGQLQTLLLSAAEHNASGEVAKVLAANGADVTAALLIAVKEKDALVVKMLVEAGADVTAVVVSENNCTPLHLAAQRNEGADVIRALVEAGASVDARDEEQRTPLHFAALSYQSNVQPLLECRANVNLLTSGINQISPLYWAALYEDREVVTALCKAGADPNLGEPSALGGFINEEMRSLIRQLATR